MKMRLFRMTALMLSSAIVVACGSRGEEGSPGVLECSEAALAWANTVDEATMLASSCSIDTDCVLREPVLECDADVLIAHPHVAVNADLSTDFDTQIDAARLDLCGRVANCTSSSSGFTSPMAVCEGDRCTVTED